MKFQWQKTLLACSLLLILPVLPGCDTQRPVFTDMIDLAEAAAGEIQTYRIEMEVTYDENGEINRSSGKLECVLPDKLHTVYNYETGTEESIIIGEKMYTLSHTDNGWREQEWPGSSASFGITSYIEQLGSLIDIEELADENIDGVACYHYQGRVDMEARIEEQQKSLIDPELSEEERLQLSEQFSEQMRRWQLASEFWIGQNDYFLRQLAQHQETVMIRDEGEDTEHEERYVVDAVFRFFDFNELITIEAPLFPVE